MHHQQCIARLAVMTVMGVAGTVAGTAQAGFGERRPFATPFVEGQATANPVNSLESAA